MGTFTMSLQELEDSRAANWPTITQAEWFGLDVYPINEGFDRDALNKKILDHYWFQEIGRETQEEFEFVMRRRMNEIMPPMNQLYSSAQLEFDPFKTINITNNATVTRDGTNSSTNHGTTNDEIASGSRAVHSDTPQTMLQGDEDYATNANDVKATTTNDHTADEQLDATVHDATTNESTTSGYSAIPANLLNAYRATILNIDMLIIDQLDDLFMQIWNSSDEMLPRRGSFIL